MIALLLAAMAQAAAPSPGAGPRPGAAAAAGAVAPGAPATAGASESAAAPQSGAPPQPGAPQSGAPQPGAPPQPAAAPQSAAAPPSGGTQKPPLPEVRPQHVRTEVQPASDITLGEPVTWTIAIDHDARDTYSLPDKIDPAPLALLGAPVSQRTDAAGLATTTIRVTFADYQSLEPRVPDLLLRVEGPAGERALTVPGRPLPFHSLIASEGQGSKERAHHGPKPPVPVMVRSVLWLFLLLGIAATAVLAVLLQRLIARRRKAEAAPKPAVPADEEALARLAALKAQPPGRAAIFTLSEIVRAYLGRRLDFNALDLTSDELLARLQQRRLQGLELRAFEEDVRWQDLVKFARLEPLPGEFARSVSQAEELVRRTRSIPRPAQTRAA